VKDLVAELAEDGVVAGAARARVVTEARVVRGRGRAVEEGDRRRVDAAGVGLERAGDRGVAVGVVVSPVQV
jgi:hypothetical protein